MLPESGTTFDMNNHKLGFRLLKGDVNPVEAIKSFAEGTVNSAPEASGYLPAAIIQRKDSSAGFLYSATENVPYGALEELIDAFTVSSSLTGHPVTRVLIATEGNLLILDPGDDGEKMDMKELQAANAMGLVHEWGESAVMIVSHDSESRAFVAHAPIREEGEWRTLGEWVDENKKVQRSVGGRSRPFQGLMPE